MSRSKTVQNRRSVENSIYEHAFLKSYERIQQDVKSEFSGWRVLFSGSYLENQDVFNFFNTTLYAHTCVTFVNYLQKINKDRIVVIWQSINKWKTENSTFIIMFVSRNFKHKIIPTTNNRGTRQFTIQSLKSQGVRMFFSCDWSYLSLFKVV